MYLIWYFLFACNPALLLVGMTGLFGKEAKRAANDFAEALGIILLILVAVFLIYLVLKAVGLVH